MAALSQPAIFAKMTLEEHPQINTPQLIGGAANPIGIQQMDVPDALEGLRELEAAGLAVESGGRWQLT